MTFIPLYSETKTLDWSSTSIVNHAVMVFKCCGSNGTQINMVKRAMPELRIFWVFPANSGVQTNFCS